MKGKIQQKALVDYCQEIKVYGDHKINQTGKQAAVRINFSCGKYGKVVLIVKQFGNTSKV